MENGGNSEKKPPIKNRWLKKAFALIVLLLALATLAFLFLIFRTAEFIPNVIDDILLGMCVAAALLSVWMFKEYIDALNGK